ncbi:Proteasome subunit beta type-7 [Microtus ochrogaster]|uniref:Proteasome subunit beta type-7 n=1 Tax=Microtus ochrogaster TaxID=79684 RepID=A0A8J6GP38_MICOH|nr:Proteasome subunit beta type-7 [Microtus ochrogaster]
MEEEEAKKLVSEAVAAGIFNDLGSGSNIDLCVISKSKLDFLRPYSVPNKKGTRFGWYRYEKGITAVLTEKVTTLDIEKRLSRPWTLREWCWGWLVMSLSNWGAPRPKTYIRLLLAE